MLLEKKGEKRALCREALNPTLVGWNPIPSRKASNGKTTYIAPIPHQRTRAPKPKANNTISRTRDLRPRKPAA